ncbi:MAG TPA: YncE family protein [Ktedonobacteraceae bacterium]|nr:YncE family protein [Ktedonobacteraceae bacterium]
MIAIVRIFYLCSLSMLLLFVGVSASAAHADGGAPQLAYVAGTARGISIIDIAQRRITGSIALAGDPHTVLLSPDGSMLYVSQPSLGRVAVIETQTKKIRCIANLPGQPSLLALSLDATVLYAAGQGDTSARAINPATCAIEHTFETQQPVYGLAVAASTAPNATPSTPNQLWITGTTSLTVYEVNGHLLGSMPIAGGPQNISIPGGFTAYVTTRQGTVVAIDLYTRKVIGTLLTGGTFGSMDYNAITGEVYVPDEQHNRLDVLVPVTLGTTPIPHKPARIIPLSGSPLSVAITNDGQLGFAALSNGQVIMLDIPGRSTVASIAVGGTPHFIITGLYPPASGSTATIEHTSSSSSPALPMNIYLFIVVIVLVVVLAFTTFWFLRRLHQKRYTGSHALRKRL